MSFWTTAASGRLLGLAACVGVSQPAQKARGARRMRESQGLDMRSSASDVVTRAGWTKPALQKGRRGTHPVALSRDPRPPSGLKGGMVIGEGLEVSPVDVHDINVDVAPRVIARTDPKRDLGTVRRPAEATFVGITHRVEICLARPVGGHHVDLRTPDERDLAPIR